MAVERNEQPRLEDRWDMSEFYAGKAYFEAHFAEIKAKHKGKYVVIFEGKIVLHSEDLRTISLFLKEHYPDRPIYAPFVGEVALPRRHAFGMRPPIA
jgi:hypothetical protein